MSAQGWIAGRSDELPPTRLVVLFPVADREVGQRAERAHVRLPAIAREDEQLAQLRARGQRPEVHARGAAADVKRLEGSACAEAMRGVDEGLMEAEKGIERSRGQ